MLSDESIPEMRESSLKVNSDRSSETDEDGASVGVGNLTGSLTAGMLTGEGMEGL